MNNNTNEILEVMTVEGDLNINGYLKEGWKIISSSTYYSPEFKGAVSGALMSKPSETEETKTPVVSDEWGKYSK